MAKYKRTLIQEDSSSVVKAMLERIKSLSSLDHKLAKRELRELFVSAVLKKFLSVQFDIGSGIIVNHKGNQSKQTDIIIYDQTIIPPFIKEQGIGVYPAESVIATIEVKSRLRSSDVADAESAAKHLHTIVYNNKGYWYQNYPLLKYKPLCGIIGFYGTGGKDLSKEETGTKWLDSNLSYLSLLCLTGKYAWSKVGYSKPTWTFRKADNKTHEEIKKFISIAIDNIRTISELRKQEMLGTQTHYDWLSIYLRDQEEIKKYFDQN